MSNGITRDEMRDLFDRYFGSGSSNGSGGPSGPSGPSFDIKTYNELIKKIKETTESLKKQIPAHQQLSGLLSGQRRQYIDTRQELEQLNKQIRELGETATEAADVENMRTLRAQRDAAATSMVQANARAAVTNFSLTIGTVAQTLLKGAFQYAKDLQSGASGTEAGANAAITAVTATGEAVSGFGSVVQGAGSAIAGLFTGKLRFLGPILEFAGVGLEFFGKKAAEVSKEGLVFLNKELTNTKNSFKSIHETGAVFGGGMTELRNVAAGAGLDIVQLAAVVSKSKDSLAVMGLGLGEATKRIAGVSKELRNSELGEQLRKLGYGAEEQAEISAQVAANLNAAGKLRTTSDAEIARQTVMYGKDLKILADITGKDAKAAAEKARTTAMQADIMARLGPEESKRFQAQIRGMPEAFHKGFIQYIASGGQAVTDVATNVLMSQQPEIKKAFDQGLSNIRDTSKTATQVQEEALLAGARIGEAERNRARSGDAFINMANTLGPGVSHVVSAVAELTNSVLMQTQTTEASVKTTVDATEKMAQNMALLDDSVAKADDAADKLRSAMGDKLTPAVTKFAEGLATATTTVEDALEKLGVKTEAVKESGTGTGEKVGMVGGALAGGAGGAMIGQIAGGILGLVVGGLPGAYVGAKLGGVAGGVAGGYLGSEAGETAGAKADESGLTKSITESVSAAVGTVTDTISSWFNNNPGKALGGISTGPKSGYLEKLHGVEAVVPLSGGRSIPVSFNDSQAFSNLSRELSALQNNNSQMSSNLSRDFSELHSNILSSLKNNNSQMSSDLSKEIGELHSKILRSQSLGASTGMSEKKYQIPPADLSQNSATSIDFSSISNSLKSIMSTIVPANDKSSSQLTTTEAGGTKSFSDSSRLAELDLNKSIREQMAILREIKDTLTSSRDLQQQFVYNTYS
jgi:hypothetical protein